MQAQMTEQKQPESQSRLAVQIQKAMSRLPSDPSNGSLVAGSVIYPISVSIVFKYEFIIDICIRIVCGSQIPILWYHKSDNYDIMNSYWV